MSVSDADIAFARDLLSDLGPLSTRKMFGGCGLYSGGTIFALLRSDGRLYLKASGAFAARLAAAGGEPFTMERDGVTRSMGYLTLPPDALDDPALACEWAGDALALVKD